MNPQVVCFGEILWDLLPSGEQPGGAPMSVAYHLKKLGLEPALISRVGKDDYGGRLLQLLAIWQLPTHLVQVDDHYPTGVVHAHPNEHHEVTYEIVQPVAWDFIGASNELIHLVEQSEYFIYGSLAARSNTSGQTVRQLLQVAPKKVFDINIRPPHFTQEVALELFQDVYLLKLNEHELPIVAGWIGESKSFDEQLQQVQDHFQIPVVVVTRGGAGAVLRTNSVMHSHAGFSVQVADTVGSGDAFLAALLAQLHSGAAPADALAFACATGAFMATKQGACPHYNVDEILKILKQ